MERLCDLGLVLTLQSLQNDYVQSNMNRILASTWNEIRTAYASGIGLSELARNMDIPAGTVLARAKREGWTAQITSAKAITTRPAQSPTGTTPEAVARTMAERGQRHIERMAGVTEKVIPHLERMQPNEILFRVDQVEKLDKIARRTFGLNDGDGQTNVMVNVALLGS